MSDPTALPLRLNEAQRIKVASLVRADIRKCERRIANAIAAGRPFVPAPGKRDVAKWELERLRELLTLLETYDVHQHELTIPTAQRHSEAGIADPVDPHRHVSPLDPELHAGLRIYR